MRRKNYFLTSCAAALLLAGASCSEDDAQSAPKPGDGILTKPVLTLSAESVRIDPEQPDESVLRAEWTAATTDEQVSVRYSLYVNIEGRDMYTDPLVFDAGTELNYDFTNNDLNRMLISDLEIEPGTETPLRFAVYAENLDDEFDTQLSEIQTCTVTPQATYPAYPPSVILVGAATLWGWDLTQGLEIPETEEGSHLYEASDVELHVQPASLNNGFKFYFSRSIDDLDDPRFAAQDLASSTFGVTAIYKEGEAQFEPGDFGYESGLYSISLDLDELTLTINRTGDLPEPTLPDQLYLLGDAFTWGWTWDGTPLAKAEEGIYRAEGLVMDFGDNGDRGFKMYERYNDWSVYYAMTDDATADNITLQRVTDSEAPQVYPGKLGFKKGTYTMEVNLNTMVMTLTEESGVDLSTAFSMTGEATPGGWDIRTYLNKIAENEWEATGIQMNFADEYKGFKIFASADGWWPWYGQKPDGEFGDLIQIDDQEASDANGDPQFYPQRFGYTSGVYTINLNLNTMKLTLTKEIDYSTALSMNGAATPGGWDSRTYLPKKADNEWEATGVQLNLDEPTNGFKIYSSADGWWPYYGQKPGSTFGDVISVDEALNDELNQTTGDPQFYPQPAGYTSGRYTINLNLNTMKLTLTKEE